jgi:hypothetical protein
MLELFIRKFVIKKPDNVKKIAIPKGPDVSFSLKNLGPNGSKCVERTNKILIPRHPSKEGNRTELMNTFQNF